MPYDLQLGDYDGSHYVMASMPGRPYNVGFKFRIISAYPGLFQNVESVTEYRYDASFDIQTAETVVHVNSAAPRKLGRGDYIEYTAGRVDDRFTIVHIKCERQCEVRIRPAYIMPPSNSRTARHTNPSGRPSRTGS